MSSRILQIQRRHAELFRIRLGDKAASGAPQRLVNKIRITSSNRSVVAAFAETYGGRVMKWEDRGKQAHQVYLPVNRLPVTLLPGQNLSQTMELWAGSTCQRRCDGVTMTTGEACACGADLPLEDRECAITSRLTVACPDVPIVGVGTLVTHSRIAAEELSAALSLAEPILATNQSVRATLKIDALVTPGHKFNVPRLQLEGITFEDIAIAAQSQPALGVGSVPEPVAIGGGE